MLSLNLCRNKLPVTDTHRRTFFTSYGNKTYVPFGEGNTITIPATKIVATSNRKITIDNWVIAKRHEFYKVFHKGSIPMEKDYTLNDIIYHDSYGYDDRCQCGESIPKDVKVSATLMANMVVIKE